MRLRTLFLSLVTAVITLGTPQAHPQTSCASLGARTALGCQFWAVDLDKIEPRCSSSADCASSQTCNLTTGICEPNPASAPFSIVVTNPQPAAATLTVTNMSTTVSSDTVVPAESSALINLDRLDVSGTGITRYVYRVLSSLPVYVLQNNQPSLAGFGNDSSLLLPQHTLGVSYVAAGWPAGPFGELSIGATAATTVTVVATANGTTALSVTPTAPIAAGGGIGPFVAETPFSVNLTQGDVLNLEAVNIDDDLSGTWFVADADIAVFAAHECAFVPDDPLTPYCAHLEEQLPPVDSLGTVYLAAKLPPRGTENDVWRIVATADNTLISADPASAGVSGAILQSGEVLEFQSAGSLLLTTTEPVLLAQLSVGSTADGVPLVCPADFGPCTSDGECAPPTTCEEGLGFCVVSCSGDNDCRGGGLPSGLSCHGDLCASDGAGDPSLTYVTPVASFRKTYEMATTLDFSEHWVSLAAPAGSSILVDGESLPPEELEAVGTSGFEVAHRLLVHPLMTEAVRHTLAADNPIGVTASGTACLAAYAYPGDVGFPEPPGATIFADGFESGE